MAGRGSRESFGLRPDPRWLPECASASRSGDKALLKRRGLGPDSDPGTEESLSRDEPGLAVIYSASVRSTIASGLNTGNRIAASGDQIDGASLDSLRSPRCATVSGFSVHGNVAIPAHDRMRLERLARYAARPALSTERLSELPDGRLLYRLKRRWRNGTTEVVFERADFIAKLAALVPAPRAHLTRFHGILAPAAKWRSSIVPSPEVPFGTCPHATAATKPRLQKESETDTLQVQSSRQSKNYSWSALLKRVFEIDVLVCERCGGPVRVIAAIQERQTTEKILNYLGLPAKPPPTAPAHEHCSFPDYL
jgi:Putative transposase